MLLIMREWFCLNESWKVKSSHEKKFLIKKKSSSLKIKVSEVLLYYKDTTFDESTNLRLKVIIYLFLWNVKFYDHERYRILWEEVYT